MATEKKEENTKKAEQVEKKNTSSSAKNKPTSKKENSTKTTDKKVTTKSTKSSNKTNKKSDTTKNKKAETENVSKKVEAKKEVKAVDIQKMQEVLKQEIKSKKIVTEEQQKKMNGEVFKNIIIAIAIVLFLHCIILGFINIESSIFIVDLKVFAISLLAVAIGIFEFAYKKDSGKIAIHGIEILALALCMLAFIYIDIMLNSKFVIIAIIMIYVISIYYTAKSVIVYQKMKKQYLIDSIKKEIIKK